MTKNNTAIIAVLEKSRADYRIKADAFEASYKLTESEDDFAEFALAWENIHEIDDQIRFYSARPLDGVRRIIRRLSFTR